ncbi:hypothetical protein V496_02146 [Pseudogymnoascus sp. VKM F-4515 (FW-2607)]|nr:hypothetical protein V496_02146 [Pseudogymnoascus sp. VKM F-4515 (FW-2607)]
MEKESWLLRVLLTTSIFVTVFAAIGDICCVGYTDLDWGTGTCQKFDDCISGMTLSSPAACYDICSTSSHSCPGYFENMSLCGNARECCVYWGGRNRWIVDFKTLLGVAKNYTATHNTDRTPDQLVMEYMRHQDYTGPTWTYNDPFYGISLYTQHLTATMNGVYLIGQPSSLEISRADVAGWGGDLIQLYGEWRRDIEEYPDGRQYVLLKMGHVNSLSRFKMRDAVADADGYNIAMSLRADLSLNITTAMENHLRYKGDYMTRFKRFYAGRFGSSFETTSKTAKAMLLPGTDDIINAGRVLLIKQAAGRVVKLPHLVPDADLQAFVEGFAQRLGELVAAEARPKVLPLNKAVSEVASEHSLLKALRAVLRDDHAQFRTPQQKEAVRLSAAKETPLVAILPPGGGKSLVFMVPAMLSGSGVTIVVAPYAELKRQLVTRCIDAGLDCKHWPEAREGWPRVVLVSAEAASSDDFLQWAADVGVRGKLDRVVIDECHLTFTAADEYRKKLRGLVLLRNLGCPFVFLTGTLPPLCQREFEEAMQLQNPLYIRASSHRVNVEYSVVRVKNGRGATEVQKLVESRVAGLAPGEKGVIYCNSHMKCKVLAQRLGCHYYHGNPEDSNAHFVAQREAGFQAWLGGETPYIVATAALGTGIDVPGITHVIHLEAPHSIIDYAQEAGRAGRGGERVAAVVVIEENDWPEEDAAKDSCLLLN